MSTPPLPPLLEGLNIEQFRQRLAGLLDPLEQIAPDFKDEQKRKAIEFVACLPEVFGSTLDRMTLWDRIGTGLQTAYAKTAGQGYEFFISRVLEHIKAEPSQVARCTTIQFVMQWLEECPSEARHAWLTYMHTHLYAVLVHAKSAWEQHKTERAESRNGNGRMEVSHA